MYEVVPRDLPNEPVPSGKLLFSAAAVDENVYNTEGFTSSKARSLLQVKIQIFQICRGSDRLH